MGDREMNLILRANGLEAICTLVDRKTNFCLLVQHPEGRKAKALSHQVNRRLKTLAMAGRIHSITTNNGSEFAHFRSIERTLNVDIFFASPQQSSDKPYIEHLNKLIRQYLPKGASFKEVTSRQLIEIQWKLNSRSRKKPG